MLHNPKLAAVLCKPIHTAKSVKSHKTPREGSLKAILCDPQFKDACGNHSDGMPTEKKNGLALINLLSWRFHTLWLRRLSGLHRCFSAFAAEPRAEPANPGQGFLFPAAHDVARKPCCLLAQQLSRHPGPWRGLGDPGEHLTRSTCTLRPFHKRPCDFTRQTCKRDIIQCWLGCLFSSLLYFSVYRMEVIVKRILIRVWRTIPRLRRC